MQDNLEPTVPIVDKVVSDTLQEKTFFVLATVLSKVFKSDVQHLSCLEHTTPLSRLQDVPDAGYRYVKVVP